MPPSPPPSITPVNNLEKQYNDHLRSKYGIQLAFDFSDDFASDVEDLGEDEVRPLSS